jgi:hypothetical protein
MLLLNAAFEIIAFCRFLEEMAIEHGVLALLHLLDFVEN